MNKSKFIFVTLIIIIIFTASSFAHAATPVAAVASAATAALPAAAEPKTVEATSSTVFINGSATSFEAYLINDNNYFKLRDLAFALNGTEKQFEVSYDESSEAITMAAGEPYTPVGDEMEKGDGAAKIAMLNAGINIALNGEPVEITAYLINDYNFMKLRDVMSLLDVYVGYDEETLNITIDTSRTYAEGLAGVPETSPKPTPKTSPEPKPTPKPSLTSKPKPTPTPTPASSNPSNPSKPSKPSELTPAEIEGKAELTRWITATAALINYQNFGNHQLFDLPKTDRLAAQSRGILNSSQWSIMNADDLREQITALTYGGHHLIFDDYYEMVDILGVVDAVMFLESLGYEDVDARYLEVIKELGDKWTYKSVVAWDLFRVGTLVSWGYMAGYIDSDEACSLMEPVVSQLKFRFNDWDEAVDNYLDGYCFWSRTDPALSNTEYTTRKKSYNELKKANPGLYDDSLFSKPHIVNFQITVPPTDKTLSGYWDMILDTELGYTKAQFYFDGKGKAASLYVKDGQSDFSVGPYFIGDNVASVVYTYMRKGSLEMTSSNKDEIVGIDTFQFCLSADAKQLFAVDLHTGDSYIFNKFDGKGFPEIP